MIHSKVCSKPNFLNSISYFDKNYIRTIFYMTQMYCLFVFYFCLFICLFVHLLGCLIGCFLFVCAVVLFVWCLFVWLLCCSRQPKSVCVQCWGTTPILSVSLKSEWGTSSIPLDSSVPMTGVICRPITKWWTCRGCSGPFLCVFSSRPMLTVTTKWRPTFLRFCKHASCKYAPWRGNDPSVYALKC